MSSSVAIEGSPPTKIWQASGTSLPLIIGAPFLEASDRETVLLGVEVGAVMGGGGLVEGGGLVARGTAALEVWSRLGFGSR